jgi:hypothetical protein
MLPVGGSRFLFQHREPVIAPKRIRCDQCRMLLPERPDRHAGGEERDDDDDENDGFENDRIVRDRLLHKFWPGFSTHLPRGRD